MADSGGVRSSIQCRNCGRKYIVYSLTAFGNRHLSPDSKRERCRNADKQSDAYFEEMLNSINAKIAKCLATEVSGVQQNCASRIKQKNSSKKKQKNSLLAPRNMSSPEEQKQVWIQRQVTQACRYYLQKTGSKIDDETADNLAQTYGEIYDEKNRNGLGKMRQRAIFVGMHYGSKTLQYMLEATRPPQEREPPSPPPPPPATAKQLYEEAKRNPLLFHLFEKSDEINPDTAEEDRREGKRVVDEVREKKCFFYIAFTARVGDPEDKSSPVYWEFLRALIGPRSTDRCVLVKIADGTQPTVQELQEHVTVIQVGEAKCCPGDAAALERSLQEYAWGEQNGQYPIGLSDEQLANRQESICCNKSRTNMYSFMIPEENRYGRCAISYISLEKMRNLGWRMIDIGGGANGGWHKWWSEVFRPTTRGDESDDDDETEW